MDNTTQSLVPGTPPITIHRKTMNIYIDSSADGRVEYVVVYFERTVTRIKDLDNLAKSIWPGVDPDLILVSKGRWHDDGVTLTNTEIESENRAKMAVADAEREEAQRRAKLTEEQRYVEDMLDKKIDVLELPTRVQRALEAEYVRYLGDLITYKYSLGSWPGFGKKSIATIEQALLKHRLKLGMDLWLDWQSPDKL